jgi:IS5 family transposase
MSKPQSIDTRQDELFRNRLSAQLNPKHPLFLLAAHIDWQSLEAEFTPLYQAELGHPPLPIRLMVGLMMLQHIEGLSDEQVVNQWVDKPYHQYFCGYDHFQWKLPLDPSSLTRWRKRIGERGIEKILAATIEVAQAIGQVSRKDCSRVIVDSTVMEKAITYPTDSQLLRRAREQLVALAKQHGVKLRQNYTRLGKAAFIKSRRYGHAGQYKRMNEQVKKLKNYLGRVVRDMERKALPGIKPLFEELLAKANRLLAQSKETPNKLYSIHAPEVACIAKGKANKRYEFGCKVSLVLTHKQGLALSAQALQANPYDGHTLKAALNHAQSISGIPIAQAFVDKGYKKHGVTEVEVLMSGQRGLSPSQYKALKRRSSIEPHIGHMKQEGKLGRNYLKGEIGDALQALLVAVGHNLRLILNYLRKFFAWINFFIFALSPA